MLIVLAVAYSNLRSSHARWWEYVLWGLVWIAATIGGALA